MRLLEYEDTSKLLFQKANELLHDQNNVDMIEKLKTLINALANVSKLAATLDAVRVQKESEAK